MQASRETEHHPLGGGSVPWEGLREQVIPELRPKGQVGVGVGGSPRWSSAGRQVAQVRLGRWKGTRSGLGQPF